MANFITDHDILKVVIRVSLLPLVAISYFFMNFGPGITLVMILLVVALSIFVTSAYWKRVKASNILS